MTKRINWGILGCGKISRTFAKALMGLTEANLYAVASRSTERAEAFGKEFRVKNTYGNYEQLANDPEIDIIYIGTTHNFHKENTLLCLEKSKAVLCEKPICINRKETEEIIKLARKNKLFLMEAMWMRFLPVMYAVREWIDLEIIGEIKIVQADFGFCAPWDPEDRVLNIKLAGGALLDVGIYPVSFASMVLKKIPVDICSSALIGETGVDEQSAYILSYDNGALAILSSAVRTKTPHNAVIIGSKGIIEIPDFWHGVSANVTINGKKTKKYRFPLQSNGYNYEALEAMEYLKNNKLESEIMPLDESLAIMSILDRIRSQWKLVYPGE